MESFEKTDDGEKSLPEFSFAKRMLLFVAAYVVFFVASLLQLYAGDFIPQESGLLDSVTSYDYIMPAIDSAVAVLTLAAFFLAGYFSYAGDKVKMLRYPMAFGISHIAASFFSFFLTALFSTPVFGLDRMEVNLIQLQSVGSAVINAVTAFLLFLYFDREGDDEYSSYNDYYVENPSAYRSLRAKILSRRFSVFVVAAIVVGAEALAAKLSRTALTALVMKVPDDYLWVSYYIEVVADVLSYGVCVLAAWYFARNVRTTAKLIGIICLAEYAVNCLSFINSSISNVFAEAGDHWLNSVFSAIFVGTSSFVISLIKFAAIVFVCFRLYKFQQDY